MTRPTLTIDSADFRQAADALAGQGFDRRAGVVAERTIRKAGNATRREIRAAMRPHRRTGRMAAAVRVRVKGRGIDAQVKVHATGGVVPIIVKGQKGHEIVPRTAQVLAIQAPKGSGGAVSFAAAVQHPAVAGDPVVAHGIEHAQGAIHAEVAAGAAALRDELAKMLEGKRR